MDKLAKAILDNQDDVKTLIAEQQNWKLAFFRFDMLFKAMSNPKDAVWNTANFELFKRTYADQKASDKGMSNIVVRTLSGMPDKSKNAAKIMFLQIAEICTLFNAAHKVNFEAQELPENYPAIAVVPANGKGLFTYAQPTPSIYKKTSLTFDYWVPKFIEWTDEIRQKSLTKWQDNEIFAHDSATDFLRLCLLFISGPKSNPPVAKSEDREALLRLLGHEFIWIKKSAKREDIQANNKNLVSGLAVLDKKTGIKIPLEAWSRIQQTSFVKSLIK